MQDLSKTSHTYPDLFTPKSRLATLNSLLSTTPLPRRERYAYRSFDRQWALIDNRLGDYLRPDLWKSYGPEQVYMVGMLTKVLGFGISAVATSQIPDLDYFAGRGGKDVIPLYLDDASTQLNVTPGLLNALAVEYKSAVSGEDLFAYAYALLANPGYVETHADELTVPGPRLPITKDASLFAEGAKLGRELLNLHTYGERFAASGSRAAYRGKARNTKAIPTTTDEYPEDFSYNPTTETLKVGDGEFSPVPLNVYTYSVSGLIVLQSWLNYRKKAGYGKKSSSLDEIRPEVWTADMTRELLELIWLLERTLELEPAHTDLLKRVEAGECFTSDELPKPEREEEVDEESEEEGDMPKLL